eukprot:515541_1
MSFDERFLKKNCAKQTKISSNGMEVCYAQGNWNTCYGNVVIDPKKFPNAQYKWTIIAKCMAGSLNMGIGIMSRVKNRNYNDKFWNDEASTENRTYIYYTNKRKSWTKVSTTTEKHSETNPYKDGDIITMD